MIDIHPSNNTAARPHQHGAPEGEVAQVPQVRLRRRLQVVPHDAPPPTAPRLRALRHIRHRQQVEDGEARQGQEKLPQLKTLQVPLEGNSTNEKWDTFPTKNTDLGGDAD